MKNHAFTYFLTTLFLLGCGLSANNQKAEFLPDFTENPIGSGEPFTPVPETTPNTTPVPPDACQNSGAITVSPTSVDFGLNQISGEEVKTIECQTITVSGCLAYQAEIAEGSSPEFTLQKNNANVAGRAEGPLSVCYKRTSTGDHEGRANLFISSGAYFYSIALRGTTLGEIFSITSPTQNPKQVIWEHYQNQGQPVEADVNAPFKTYFNLQTSGEVKLNTFGNIISKREMLIAVKNGGRTKRIELNNSESFVDTLQIPEKPDRYPVEFSVETTKGVLRKTIDVIRYTAPKAFLEIRDKEGNRVNAVATHIDETKKEDDNIKLDTDSNQLILGIRIPNLLLSAPDKHLPLETTVFVKKGNQDSSPEETVRQSQKFFSNYFSEPGAEASLKCPTSFSEVNSSLCIPLPPTDHLAKGVNIIRASICSEYTRKMMNNGCITAETSVNVDNDVPLITITEPSDKQLFGESGKIKLKGHIENFQKENITKDSQGRVTKTECLVKLWVNTSVDQPAYDICNLPSEKEEGKDCNYFTILSSTDGNYQSGNAGNVRRADFCIELEDKTGDNQLHRLTKFTNILELQAQDTKVHTAIKTLSFKRGNFIESNFKPTLDITSSEAPEKIKGDLTTLQLGGPHPANGTVIRAPLMFDLAEGTLNLDESGSGVTADLIAAIEKAIKDNFKAYEAKSLLTNGPLKKKDADGKCVTTAKDKIGEICVEAKTHGTAQEKLRALIELNRCNKNPGHDPQMCAKYAGQFNPEGGNNMIFFDPSFLQDTCGNVQTSAIVFYDQLQSITKGYAVPSDIHGRHPYNSCNARVRGDCPWGEWPRFLAKENLNFDDVEVGLLKLNHINLKSRNQNGDSGYFIDLNLSLKGQNGAPALWGHGIAYNLAIGGSSGQFDDFFDQTNLEDPIIPVILNIGEVSVDLVDVLEIKKIHLNDDGSEPYCRNGVQVNDKKIEGAVPCNWLCHGLMCANKVILHKENIKINREGDNLELYSYLGCAQKYKQQVYQSISGSNQPMPSNFQLPAGIHLPFGCTENGEVEPILVERNTFLGNDLYVNSDYGNNRAFLSQLEHVLLATIKNTLTCLPNEVINPMIDSTAFEYPSWVDEDSKIKDLTFVVDKIDGKTSAKLASDKDYKPQKPLLTLKPNIKDADILPAEGHLQLKLPVELGMKDVEAARSAFPALSMAQNSIYRLPGWGFLSRLGPLPNLETNYPLTELTNEPYFSLSVGIEDLLNSLTHLLFKKGLPKLLDFLNVKRLDPPAHFTQPNNLTIGLDKVILGRFDACDISGLLASDLAPTLLFAEIPELFGKEQQTGGTKSTHWDIILDENTPPTLFIDSINSSTDVESVIVQIGLSNVTIAVHDLVNSNEKYRIGNNPVLSLRLDALLKLKLIYNRYLRELQIFILPLNQTPLYASVIEANGIYDHNKVIKDVWKNLVVNAFGKLAVVNKDGQPIPSFVATLPSRLTHLTEVFTRKPGEQFSNTNGILIVNNTNLAPNKSCDGEEPLYIEETESVKDPEDSDEPIRERKRRQAEGDSPPRVIDDLGDREDVILLPNVQKEENAVKDLLDDIGLEEIFLSQDYPNLQFDFRHGYLHFSTGFSIEINPSVYNEVRTE